MASHSNRALCRAAPNAAVVFAFGTAALCFQVSASSGATRSDSLGSAANAITLKRTASSIAITNSAGGEGRSSINPTDTAPAITSPNSATFTVGVPKVFTVTATGDPTPALSESGPLPSGISFTDNNDGTATLSGTAASGSDPSYSLTFTASNGVAPDAMQSFTLQVNQAPDAEPDLLGTFTDTPLTVSTGRLLDNDSDPDGDTIVVTSVTPSGGPNSGSVSLNGAMITYTPAPGFMGQDTFNYTISDGKGGTATAIVTVTIGDRSSFRITSITDSPAHVDLKGIAIPGSFCVIQIAGQAQGPYTDFTGTIQIGPDGNFAFEDFSMPRPGQQFYRVRLNN